MRTYQTILYFLLFVFFFGNCQKKGIEPQNYFEAIINNKSELLKLTEAYVDKGITEIVVNENIESISKTIKITINSDKPGRYHQYFDYKTGVSMSECGLIYEILESNDDKTPKYFKSIEGQVEISSIDSRKKSISGTYNFRINSLSDKNTPGLVKGKFINISYKKN